ncbi:hypothetical protein Acr_00g0005950 [Actinidia rufa]|uniref:NB-ARC domain-containing disease resistance protein n=1 Tax=Actinidia rufa TaxID=165716 RepID=A0A7J0D9L0_9ERIC|nr:hypothetical protein Acr_00g0005950 [Actinidia rufa]
MMENEVQKLEENRESKILSWRNCIDKLIAEIEELHEEGRFPGGLLLDTWETTTEPLLAPELTIQTSKRNLEEIFKYLMDDKVWCIGIHGMGGVGKTTLALHIYNRLVRDVEKFGYRPYWVTVSQESSIGKLQNDIAKNLELDFSNEGDERKRAAKLSRALTRENCVLILDDVWKKIALDKVGIPDKVNGHKLILTTRSWDVCRQIGCEAKFKVQPLNEEEAWKLFEKKLGQQTELSPEVRDIAMSVAAKCAAGVGLKDIPAEREWTEDLDMVSLMGNRIGEIPHGRSPRCPRLSTLLLNEIFLRKIADSFFEHMHELHVLDLSENRVLEKLPNSISDLENLTALKLQGCKNLTYVPPLGKLRALQELDLSYTRIKEVPEGVDRLVNLKNLNMEGTERLERLPWGTLCKLSHLQLLSWPNLVFLFRSKIVGFAVIAPSCGIFSNLKELSVTYCPQIKSLFTSILLPLFPNLEVIIVRQCGQIKEIIETVHEVGLETSFLRNHDIPLITLPKLKKISLLHLRKLKSIFEGRMVCESIEKIRVYKCPKLRRLPFSLPVVNGQLSAPTTLKQISTRKTYSKAADIEWWESLEWDHPDAKDALLPYLC